LLCGKSSDWEKPQRQQRSHRGSGGFLCVLRESSAYSAVKILIGKNHRDNREATEAAEVFLCVLRESSVCSAVKIMMGKNHRGSGVFLCFLCESSACSAVKILITINHRDNRGSGVFFNRRQIKRKI
jgi:hypothetical protein